MQGVAGESVHRPIGERFRSEAVVETDRGFVPIQHGPFHATAVSLDGDSSDARQQRFADSSAAIGRLNVDVFQIQTRFAQERREVVEEQCEADRNVSDFRDQCFGERSWAKL